MPGKKIKVNLAPEKQAEGQTREIFQQIKHALGVPYVATFFRALASFPQFLELFWNAAKPVVSTQEFFSFSERLGAEAYTRVHNYLSAPQLQNGSTEAHFEIGNDNGTGLPQVIELYQHSSPMLLLICAALVQEFENPGREAQPGTPISSQQKFSEIALITEEDAAPAASRKIFEDIKRTLNIPFLSSCYLNLGQSPEFLKRSWESLKPVLRTPAYEQHRLAILESALSLAAELPEPLQLSVSQMEEAGVLFDDIHRIAQVAELFLDVLSRQVLNMAFAKICLESEWKGQVAA
jgi:hypothetical protein